MSLFTALPLDLQLLIGQFLDCSSLSRLAQTCRTFRRTALDKSVWALLCHRLFDIPLSQLEAEQLSTLREWARFGINYFDGSSQGRNYTSSEVRFAEPFSFAESNGNSWKVVEKFGNWSFIRTIYIGPVIDQTRSISTCAVLFESILNPTGDIDVGVVPRNCNTTGWFRTIGVCISNRDSQPQILAGDIVLMTFLSSPTTTHAVVRFELFRPLSAEPPPVPVKLVAAGHHSILRHGVDPELLEVMPLAFAVALRQPTCVRVVGSSRDLLLQSHALVGVVSSDDPPVSVYTGRPTAHHRSFHEEDVLD
eukprot:gnl/Spiro4/986_TR524_c0_g1_i1.p1 gnl/Spiro4/986_TR524_c0_g1~~gnl/Spiro4/986_TR524_c0_g1_i1.p1  ORF type:complete len:307 (+),score=48.98 gnl/Spiro4/986_TR524_c0_g1_i1:34-954(+)